jgi:hypothetical protein
VWLGLPPCSHDGCVVGANRRPDTSLATTARVSARPVRTPVRGPRFCCHAEGAAPARAAGSTVVSSTPAARCSGLRGRSCPGRRST